MELAENKLGIPKVIEPEDLSHPEIDDLSVMTYISYFCKPANEHLLHWVQKKLPDRNITNFQKDWNNGINLACLVEVLCPGTFPNCRQLDPHNSLQNLVKAMKTGEDHLGVKPVIKPSQLADPNVDELNVVTYLSRYQYARPIPQPHEVTCSGHGLYKAFVGRPAFFNVDGTKGGVGEVDVLIKSKGGSPVNAEIKPHPKHVGMFEVKYVPHVPGKLTIEVKWSSFVIPSSPFNVDVLDPGTLSFTGKQISGGQCAKVGKNVFMEAKGLADVADLYVMIQHPDGHTETAKIVDKGSGIAECSYIPVRVGKDEVFAKIAGTDLPGSPFEVKVVDPNQCSVSLRDPPTGKAALVNKKVTFVVTASGVNLQGVIAEVKTPSGIQEVPISKQSDGSNTGTFTSVQIGKHEIMVTCAGENIRGSPINLEVSDPSKCAFLDTMPRYLQAKKPYQVNLSTKGAGTGSVDVLSSQAGILKAQMKKGHENDLYSLDLSPSTVGESTITVKWNDQALPPTPHTIFVCDASRCSAYGPGLTSGKGKIDEPFPFTVQVKGGGRGELTVKPNGPKTVYAADIKKNTDETYNVTFTTYEIGVHDIDILWGGEHIPNSPYKVDFNRGTDVSKISVRGPGLKGAVANRRAEVTVYARESKLIDDGILNISFKSASGREVEIPEVDLYDNNNGTYNVSYTPRVAGTLTLTVTGEGEQVAGSPFNIEVKPEPKAQMCTIAGKAGADVFNGGSECYQVLGKPLELTVDTTSAGTGSLTVSGEKPDKSTLRVFTTDETQRGKNVSFLKFEPTVVGTHQLSVLWDDTHIPRSPFKVHVVDPSKCVPEGGIPTYLKVRESQTVLFRTQGSGPGKLEVKSKASSLTVSTKENKQAVFTGAKLGKSEVQVTFGSYPISGSPFEVSVCDPSKCSVDLSSLQGQSYMVGVPFSFKVNAKDAGMAKLQVKPANTKHRYNIEVKELGRGVWKVTCTAWSTGTQELLLKWGDWEISGSPLQFSVSDPKKIVVSGLPDPQNYIPIIGEPISFTVDFSEAGSGTLTSKARLEDGTEKDLECEETDNANKMTSLQLVPSQPGKLELILQFNGVNILPAVCIYEVPDPSRFQVTPPKGFGKLKEYVKFPITGVTKDTDLKLTVSRPEHDATVKLEPGKDENTKIARFTPKHIGEYKVEVKHKGQNIDGSPFTVQIAHPDGCHPVGELPSTIHIGDKSVFEIDTSKAGPGTLTFFSESLSGDIEPYISPSGDTKYSIYLEQGLGKCRVIMKWADYAIPSSPFSVSFVDSSQVVWESETLTDGLVKQGEVVMIRLDCTKAGQGTPEVRARGPQSRYPVQLEDNKDGTFTIPLNPWQVGDNVIEILYGGHSVPNSPIHFEVIKPVEAHTITASGEGLSHMIVGVPSRVAINTPDPGLLDRGLLKAKFLTEGDENLPSIDLKDTGTGRYDLTLLSQEEGDFSLDISCEDKPIVGSPFKIQISPAPCSDKCFAFGPALEKNAKLVVNDPVKFTVDSTNAGSGSLKVTATQPNGKDIQIYKHNEEGDAILHHLKFDPEIVGVHKVQVLWEGADIPGSPFDFNVFDPSKVHVNGLPPAPNGLAYIGVPINFAVTMRDSGATSPVIYVDPPGDEDPTLLSGNPISSSILGYEYIPSNFGAHVISIEVGGTDVPGSPFKVNVVDPNKFSISGLNLKGDYALVCELVSIYISGNASDGGTLVVTAHGPSADLNVDTVNEGDGKYRANFVPIEPGCYEMFVEYAGAHVNGSPFTVQVADPSKCQVLGDIPTVVQVGQSEEFIIKTRGAGVGDLKSLVDEEEASIDCEIINQGLETYSVVLTGKKVDEVSLDLQWAGFPIPQSPISLSVCDANQCKAFGQALVSKKGKAGEAITFSVLTENAGKGKLSVVAKGPSAQYNIDIKETKEDSYEVTFTPWEVGEHTIEILWGNSHIPKSPFTVNVENPMDATVCNATGEGLKTAIAGQKATFMIISSEVGLIEKNALKVSVLGVQSHADVVVNDNNNGCYAVEYVAPTPGAYVASISFYDRQIPGSPFKVNVFPGPDASKCFAYGPALNQNSILIAGSPLELFVDTSEGGFGQLRVYIQGPNDYRPKVFMANDDKGVYSIKFDAMKSGKYFVVIAWSEEHIPGSPFKLRVHPAADASKVRAYGPGLLDSFLGAPGV